MEPSVKEVRQALGDMHPTKAPAPDGIHVLLFKKIWDVVGGDVVNFVKKSIVWSG